jgi:hypothetical protein
VTALVVQDPAAARFDAATVAARPAATAAASAGSTAITCRIPQSA